jgi:hypothetical protein
MKASTQIRFALQMVLIALISFLGVMACEKGDAVSAIMLFTCVFGLAGIAAFQLTDE